jgi:prophage regulatory protein
MPSKVKEEVKQEVLPATGLGRWNDIAKFLPVKKSTWLKLSAAGLAPRKQNLGSRCAFYSLAEVNRFIADPLNYVAGGN